MTIVEPKTLGTAPKGKWFDRISAVVGKESICVDRDVAADIQAVKSLIDDCHVVILSSDLDADLPECWIEAFKGCPIVCDITAFGTTGPLAGRFAEETSVQALTGVVTTTGFPGKPPTPVAIPILEMSASIYAASAVAIALRVLEQQKLGQNIEVSLFDVGVTTLTTFMPAYYAGRTPERLGNGHSMAVPWNAYPTADGWVLICLTNDAQWGRFYPLVGKELSDRSLARLEARIQRRDEIDSLISAWSTGLTLQEVTEALKDCDVPCGGIVAIDKIHEEPNLQARRSIAFIKNPLDDTLVRVAGPLIKFDGEEGTPQSIPARDSARNKANERPSGSGPEATAGVESSISAFSPMMPLAGLRVVEIGQLTTAPLSARHLASFGADVIKIEAPGGESARFWAPMREGVSHFFVASNGQKRSVELDLRQAKDREELEILLSDADVLVENMKPGALSKMGFDRDRLKSINPRLIYCAISGFGAQSVYPGRAAVDTVIQAMSGMMDATRVDGKPVKSGISAADIAGGEVGLLSIIAALARREITGVGCAIDISMQDVGAWMTQTLWNCRPIEAHAVEEPLSVAEVCTHAQTTARELIVTATDGAGRHWEVFGSPMRLERTPARIGTLIGPPSKVPLTWATDQDSSQVST
ncbi:hypothetical protein AN416_38360 (plasmid) [Paraburkholderia caribensis]|nr:hypothetical protein AN416_38360 [Paraburkholderia caribensis]